MRRTAIVIGVLALTSTIAFAQTSQPQGGSAGSPTSNPTEANKQSMDKGMTNTSGMSSDANGSMKKDNMMQGGESKDGNGMNKGGMSK